MPSPLADHPFLVRPGQRLDLPIHPTADASLFPVSKKEGAALLEDLEKRIDELQTRLYAEGKRRLLVVFQSMDTGGKDGAIRNVFDKMDPQGLRVASFKRPSGAELTRDYLWRVHREVPGDGEVVVFNRSHYEDIVTARVRQIVPEAVWRKRYRHVVEFERLLVDEGTTVLKFFLHISREEQRERLQARLNDPRKNWKFHPSDLEDRALWPKFMEAYGEVFAETSTAHAPWYVIPADRKWYRDLVAADIVAKALDGLGMEYPPVSSGPAPARIE